MDGPGGWGKGDAGFIERSGGRGDAEGGYYRGNVAVVGTFHYDMLVERDGRGMGELGERGTVVQVEEERAG